MQPSDWSRDGRHLAYNVGGDIWALPLAGERKPFQVTATPLVQELGAVFSPDGRCGSRPTPRLETARRDRA